MLTTTVNSTATELHQAPAEEQSWVVNGMLAVLGIAAASFALHMIFNNRYGYFRDEFDYIICGNHPAWGYVDQPPLVPILSRIFRWWLWGPRGYSGNCMIVLDDDQETLGKIWSNVEYVGRTPDNPYALERNLTICICRGFKQGTLAEFWPKLKRWR